MAIRPPALRRAGGSEGSDWAGGLEVQRALIGPEAGEPEGSDWVGGPTSDSPPVGFY